MSHKREIDIREYLFTDQEIEEDWNNYQKIINLKKVLRPNTILAQKTPLLAAVSMTLDRELMQANDAYILA